ncbi:CU044_5270 family protein [Streptomyces sp. NPDC051555]|uniref:CU044_5270 family protein n=1 Tax=Streptomyces sp. NPDC051555 TaxID=3365657 RepID=UPI00379518C8
MTRKFWKRTEPMTHTGLNRSGPDHGELDRAEPDHAELALLLPAPSAPAMSLDRRLLFEEHLLNEIHTSAPLPTPPRRPVRRALFIGVPVTAVALGTVFAVSALTSRGNTAPASVEAPVVAVEAGSTVQLVSTVQQIAAAASAQQTPEPGPGQFIYIKSTVSWMSTSVNGATNESKTWVQPLHQREIWHTPDASKGWLDEPGYQAKGGIGLGANNPYSKPKNGKDIPGDETRLSYDWLKAQPADAQALLKTIYAKLSGPRDRDQQAFEEIQEIINEQLVPAPTAAALYRAAAQVPGVVLVQNSQDAVGRSGLALARLDEKTGERTELVFDRTTFAYLGSRGVQVKEFGGIKPGTVVERTAVLERAVVNAEKERPAKGGTA